MIYFLLLLMITIIMYLGFGAINVLNENDIAQKEDTLGKKKVLLLHKLYQNKQYYFRTIYLVTTILHVFLSVMSYRYFERLMEDKMQAILITLTACIPVIILWIIGIFRKKSDVEVTEEEILSMVNEGQELGVIESSEALMISNIFEFGDKVAKDIMINRSNMIALDSTMKLQDACDFMLNSQYSRYPVYDETVDRIIGMLYLKDALRFHSRETLLNKSIKSIKKLLREPVYITETKKIYDIFKIMQQEKVQLAIVIDEYGQTSGIISMEDILEEIVGNILDEYDEDEQLILEKSETEYIIDGLTKLEDLEEILEIKFDSQFETLNGFMISKLEHIPSDNEKFCCEYGGYEFSILKAESKMVTSVLVEKIVESEIVDEKTSEIVDEKTTIEEDGE